MMRLFTENVPAKIVSVVIAMLLWVALVDEPELIETVTVPLEYRNLASTLDLSPDAPGRIQLQVRGSRSRLNEVSPEKTNIVLDLAGMVEPSSRTFTIQEGTINLPPRVSLVRAMPAQVRVKLERRVTREVAVAVVFENNDKLKVAAVEVSPANVVIVGPESRVKEATALSTEPIDLTAVDLTKPIRRNVLLADPETSFLGPSVVTVKVSVLPLEGGRP
jgi:YbbR domain-containing protein